jgi:2-iminobutanoate/2-iminopropanoate deaminase
MTVLGDLDVSVVRASPPGRGKILTRVVTPAKWSVVMDYVRGRLVAGEQAYVVCPLIGEDSRANPVRSESDAAPDAAPRGGAASRERISVRAEYERLTTGPWNGLRLGLLHGGLPAAEKQQILADFAAGELHAVVSTTVVEVGVDVPAATIMVVEEADRFGLSQLHQLRGTVKKTTVKQTTAKKTVAAPRATRRTVISTELAPKAIGPYSQAIRVNGFVFCAGQTPIDPAVGQLIEGDVPAQTRRVLQNLSAILEAAGTSLAKVVKTTVFLTDMANFKAMNEVYAEFFPEHPPARSTIAVAGLPLGAQVEIECIALGS